jgi:hypothetical protein
LSKLQIAVRDDSRSGSRRAHVTDRNVVTVVDGL